MLPAETEASLRENLRAQVDGARAELAANLADLRRSGGDSSLIAQFETQLGGLAALNRQIDTASPVALAMLRATVAASVAASGTLTQQASAAASNAGQSAGGVALAAASAAARQTVTAFERDMYERKIFDADLHFASAEDKEAYRKREAERFAETEQAKAEHTPQGDLRAIRTSIEQMKDAGAHGADKNLGYAPRLQLLESKESDLASAIGAPPSQSAAVDPLDKATPVNVDPAILAAFKSHGVVVADPSGQGHGVSTTTAGIAAAPAR